MSEQPRKQRAKNPGFEAWKAQYLAFKATPEGQEANRPVTKFLDEIGSRTWGYIVYRTIFNSDSDSLVSLAIEKLNALVKKEVESDLVGKDFDKSINEKVLEQWRLEIVDERGTKTGGASLEDARQMFLERMRQEGMEGRGVCLLLDEKVVTSLMNGDLEGEFLPVLKGGSYVTVVDGQWTPGQGDPEYPGWMKVNAQRLMRVFSMLTTMSLYQNWCILRKRDQDGAFILDG